jgi:hypothetical protein
MTQAIIRLFLFTILIAAPEWIHSQEVSMISPYISLQYFKDNDDNCYLKTTLSWSSNRMELPLPGMKISFSSGTSEKRILAETITDEKGVAIFNLGDKSVYSRDESGMWEFSTDFEGNDTIEAGTAELLIRDASMKMELKSDSIKILLLHAGKLENGKMIPASGELISVYVPRMFSMLPVGEATLDDNGEASLEFPSDLPGDIDGNIIIIAKFEEHPEFGNIERSTTVEWGIPSILTDHSSHRALWTKTAPKWMIYTLTILLVGVWGHYVFAFISLIRIRIDAKNTKESEPEKELFIK